MILRVAIHPKNRQFRTSGNYDATGSGWPADFAFLRTPAGLVLAASAWSSA
jgi:hypothetical protein